MIKGTSVWPLVALLATGMAACAPSAEPGGQPPDPPPDPALPLLMTEERLDELNAAAVALGGRGDAIGFFDAGETGGDKTLYLRDFGITDPDARVTIECTGYNISGDPLPAKGRVFRLVQGFNSQGAAMVGGDGTPIIRFDFEGGWHEVCGIYLRAPGEGPTEQDLVPEGPPVPAPPPASEDDLIAYFDIGESGGAKRLYLRDFGITDPDARVTIACSGVNINGDVLPARGVVENLMQGINNSFRPMVDTDGTPYIRFAFKGGWHEVCGLYTLRER